jgi:transcriptional regulator with XRE-family HTH domain
MESRIVGIIQTRFGKVELTPQDRNLLQASSVEPLCYGDVTIHLWAMLERRGETWRVSGLVEPLLHLTNGSGHPSSIPSESILAELMKPVTLLAGEWASAHPEAFEYAAVSAFKSDQEGLYRELGALRESLNCSAQAIESITSEVPSDHSARLREYSRKIRSIARDVPTMQKIAQAICYPGETPSQPTEVRSLESRDVSATYIKTKHLKDVTGRRNEPGIGESTTLSGSRSDEHPTTLGQLLSKQRKDMELSQREVALKLGVKASHVAQLESDCGARPSFQLLSRVARILEVDKDQLFQLAETRMNAASGARRAVSHPRDQSRVWGAFARNRALLDRYQVKPRELKALSKISLMGKVTGSEALLFILDAIRESGETEE